MPDSRLIDTALEYAGRGLSIIPCRPDKKPFIAWQRYQTKRATPAEIREWWAKWPTAMIGIVTGPISNLFVIDCDTEAGHAEIEALLPEALVTPIARTPRGGWHMYFLFPEDIHLTIGAGIRPGIDFRGAGGYVIAPTSRSEKGVYQWQAELSFFDVPPAALPLAARALFQESASAYIKNRSTIKENVVTPSSVSDFLYHGRRDADLFHLANCLVKGGCELAVVEKVLNILARNCNPPFPQSEIHDKISSALSRAEKREIDIAKEVFDFVVTTDGYFLTTDIYARLRLTTREEKKAVVANLLRMVKRGEIERHGQRDGTYRRRDDQADEIDFLNADETGVDMRWPFAIEKYVKLLPKNIAVVAGSPNAGKTALLLNLAQLNQARHEVIYFSSEMGALELRTRLQRFGVPLDTWTFKAKERSHDFADVIAPDALNIVDFLELHDNFYLVGGMIKAIYDKLDNGLAVIALQKNPGVETGLGGQRSIEKARLAIAMDQNRLKITKAKNWTVPGQNPNGMEIRFKLVDGCKFTKQGDWVRCQSE